MFSSSDKYDGNYREACRNLDFEAAHKILDKITTKDSWWDGHTPKEDIIAATDYIFNAETLYLTSQNTEEANNRVVYLLSELPIEGRADPEGTKIELNDDMSDDGGFTAYRSYVNRFNSKCLSILNTAISVGNKEVAEKIQSFFPDTDLNMLESSIQRYKDIDAWNETPVLKEEAFDKLQTVMQEAGELTTKAPYETIVNNEFAKKAIK